ncbi:DUF2142 domain-containing protein [Nocardia sp. 004]|uniref:DUF2142 domain-containing protein n=1 Tax=Nocardia sp. 004 TaxID=3385978 RepID=UPI00399F2AAF
MTTSADRSAPSDQNPSADPAATAHPGAGSAQSSRKDVGKSESTTSKRTVGRFVRRTVADLGAAAIACTALAALFGALFSVLTPPFWGHDEITQFGRAYQVAHGGFRPERIPDNRGIAYGGEVPVGIAALMDYALLDYTTNPEEPGPMVEDPARYDQLRNTPVSDTTQTIWFTNTAAYPPAAYFPAAIGIRLGEVLGLDVGALLLLTRLAGLAAYLAIVGFALRAVRAYRVQWLAGTVAVLPIAVFQAGTVTADTMTNALAVLISTLLVKTLFLGARLGGGEVCALLAATLLLPLCKPTYVLLAALAVLVPAERLGYAGWRRAIPWICATTGVLLFAIWLKIAAPTGEGMGLMRPRHQWDSVRPADQLRAVLDDPLAFVHVFGESIALRDQRWFNQFFGELGFAYLDVPALSIVACLLAFVVSLGVAERMHSPGVYRTLFVALIVTTTTAMIYVTLYLSFTPVGYYLIDGVQGRYFVPLAIVALAVALRSIPVRLTDTTGKSPAIGAAVTVFAAMSTALIAAAVKYYVIVWG